jgi:uncharacterized protein (DUF433 family)
MGLRAMSYEHLIPTYIEENPYQPGVADARLKEYGVPVWALIGFWELAKRDVAEVASAYELPEEAVHAAIGYYNEHRCEIDERIAANTIPAA